MSKLKTYMGEVFLLTKSGTKDAIGGGTVSLEGKLPTGGPYY